MIALVASPPRVVPVRDMRGRWPLSVLCAFVAHAAVGLWAAHSEPPARPPLALTTVVELAPKEPPPPRPAVHEPEPEPPARAAPRVRSPSRPPTEAPPPRAAAAAEVRTVGESTPTSSEPVRFVSDPSGKGFGFGIVAQGGTARVGTGASVEARATPAPATVSRTSAAPKLSAPPRLREGDPCAGEFPGEAQVDRGEALLELAIGADGRVVSAKVLDETPAGQGFGAAARRCLSRKRFEPARDLAGVSVAAQAPVKVRFSR